MLKLVAGPSAATDVASSKSNIVQFAHMDAHPMKKTLAALAIIAYAGAAFAQGASFVELDTDGNGELSFAEISAAMPEVDVDAFTEADTDGNEALSEAEFSILESSKEG
jgi:hypothetical protein